MAGVTRMTRVPTAITYGVEMPKGECEKDKYGI